VKIYLAAVRSTAFALDVGMQPGADFGSSVEPRTAAE